MQARSEATAAWRLRDMAEADLDAVLTIAAGTDLAGLNRDGLRRELQLPFASCQVLAAADGVIGYSIHWVVAGEAEIHAVAVSAGIRRQGAGRLLVESVLERVGRAGATRCQLEVAEENAAGRALYTGLGFCEVGRRRDYYGSGRDSLLFECRIMGSKDSTLPNAEISITMHKSHSAF